MNATIDALLRDEPESVRLAVSAVLGDTESLMPPSASADWVTTMQLAERHLESKQLRTVFWRLVANTQPDKDLIKNLASIVYAAFHDDTPMRMLEGSSKLAGVAYVVLLTQSPPSVSEIPNAWFHAKKEDEDARAMSQRALFETLLVDHADALPTVSTEEIVPSMLLTIAYTLISKTAAKDACRKLFHSKEFLHDLAWPFANAADEYAASYMSRALDLFGDPTRCKWLFQQLGTFVEEIIDHDMMATALVLLMRADKTYMEPQLARLKGCVAEHNPETIRTRRVVSDWLKIPLPERRTRKRLCVESDEEPDNDADIEEVEGDEDADDPCPFLASEEEEDDDDDDEDDDDDDEDDEDEDECEDD